MNPRYRLNRFRTWTGNPVVAIVLALLLAAQTATAMPHTHPADHDSAAPEMADHSAHSDHHPDTAPKHASGPDSDHTPDTRDCCEIECQECTMGSCSSLTHSRGPGFFNDNSNIHLSSLDRLMPAPMIGGLYRPPISR